MSIRQKRIGMLISLKSSLGDVQADVKNQTPEILESNMKIMQEHVSDILALDGIRGISPTLK